MISQANRLPAVYVIWSGVVVIIVLASLGRKEHCKVDSVRVDFEGPRQVV